MTHSDSPRPAPHIVPPCHEDIRILYQDDYLLVIDKPQPMLSTPGRLPENKDSAISRLQQQFPSAELVHRLDMATSGLMVIALSKLITSRLSKQFQQREVSKTYTAILQGHVDPDEGEINLPIITDWERRPLQKVCFIHGKPSLTHYRVITRYDDMRTRVEFTPITGRSHQLRIHSREMGHPILGCPLYALNGSECRATRLLLHASTLAFQHPFSGLSISFNSPAPF